MAQVGTSQVIRFGTLKWTFMRTNCAKERYD
jgi:hypothetical protein